MSGLKTVQQDGISVGKTVLGVKAYAWVILALNTGIQALFSCISTAVGILAPFLVEDLGLSKAMVGMAGGAMSIGNTFTAIQGGRIIDRRGEKLVLVACGIMTGSSFILASYVSYFPLFIALLVFTGLWSSVPVPAGSKAITQWFPSSRLGFALGFRQTGVPIGAFIGAVGLPLIAFNWGWRAGLASAGALLIAGALVFLVIYKEHPDKKPVRKEKSAGEWSFLRNHQIWACIISSFVFIGTQFIMITYLTLYICAQVNLDIQIGSRFLPIAQLGGIFARITLGIISDTLFKGARKPIIILEGFIMILTILALLSFNPGTPLWLVAVVSLFFGMSAMGWNAIVIALIMKLAPAKQGATVVGFYITVMQLGIAVCPTLFGLMIDFTGSYHLSWITLAFFILLATGIIFTIREPVDSI